MDFITPSHHYFSRPKCFLSSNNNNEECTSQSFTSCVEFKQDLLLDWVCLKCLKIQFIKVNGKRAVTMDIFSIFKRRTAIRKWQFNTKFPQAIFVECPLMEFVLRRIKIHLCICNIWVVSVYKIVLNLLINKRRHRLSKYSNRIQMSTKIVICFPNNIETNLPPYVAAYSFWTACSTKLFTYLQTANLHRCFTEKSEYRPDISEKQKRTNCNYSGEALLLTPAARPLPL